MTLPADPVADIAAVVTARGGSRRFPGKNIANFCGRPLIAHTIEAAKECREVSRVFVTTDDAKIGEVSRDCGAEVIDRRAHLSSSEATSEDTVRHALETLAVQNRCPEYFILLPPTSPLRTTRHLGECIRNFLGSGAVASISVIKIAHHPYKSFAMEDGCLKPLFSPEIFSAPKQSLAPAYEENGAIYIMRSETFLKHDSFFVEPCLAYLT